MPDTNGLPWRVVHRAHGADIVDVYGVIRSSCPQWADAELIVFLANTAYEDLTPDTRFGIVVGLEPTGPDWIAVGPVS
jgi:hypothetical protein